MLDELLLIELFIDDLVGELVFFVYLTGYLL